MPLSGLRPCKVIIAGGGIAGLTLALILERVGVDYILLEAYTDIVAAVGAGVTMLPNGLRVLDQLGCMEDLVGRAGSLIRNMSIRGSDGEVIKTSGNWDQNCPKRYGYPFFWSDRKVLLQVLYDHIADKSKLLTQKRVDSVKYAEEYVEVVTTDGSSYQGDLLVGADGIHSRVRQEMVRLATELGIEEDYAEDSRTSFPVLPASPPSNHLPDMPATYSCMFGVSSALPGIDQACIDFVANKNYSYVLGSGPENRTYWFLMRHMGQTFYGSDIPTFTDDDQAQFVQDHWDDPVTPTLRFSDLYENKHDAIYTPMREMVYKKWHLDRVIVVGDAAHKARPNRPRL
ncbi:uncharacterized protein N7459_007621 [Penicillium hispanicum]|uniref:uncharacterized protein n=1 Tax=Penicillium hispanicum TaxID=1080232 RepID=UPI0025406FFF|nr:uncharacterized protein N7459_007621 [Penicillium hispanicum]KAJ5578657.1 hypothetical protein N7459_007621 [Penicillium hispanicum]